MVLVPLQHFANQAVAILKTSGEQGGLRQPQFAVGFELDVVSTLAISKPQTQKLPNPKLKNSQTLNPKFTDPPKRDPSHRF